MIFSQIIMASSTFYNDVEVKGIVKTTLTGSLIGVVTEMPAAGSKNSGCVVLYEGTATGGYVPGTIYRNSGTSWTAIGKVTKVDSSVTDGSDNAVSGDAVHTALQSYASKSSVDSLTTTVNGKQASLSTEQLNACNSGITSSKVSTYDGYATTKADDADMPIIATNVSVSSWTADTSTGYSYKGTISLTGCTTSHMPVVTFDTAQAKSGDYCPVAESASGCVYIWSKRNTAITIPSVVAIKQ